MLWSFSASIGHVNKYPTIHHFGNPRHTQSMIAYKILTEYFWEIPVKNCIVGVVLTCPIQIAFGAIKWPIQSSCLTVAIQFGTVLVYASPSHKYTKEFNRQNI